MPYLYRSPIVLSLLLLGEDPLGTRAARDPPSSRCFRDTLVQEAAFTVWLHCGTLAHPFPPTATPNPAVTVCAFLVTPSSSFLLVNGHVGLGFSSRSPFQNECSESSADDGAITFHPLSPSPSASPPYKSPLHHLHRLHPLITDPPTFSSS